MIEDNKLLESLLYNMMRIRMVEEEIAELYSEQEMRCPVHLCIGQEAVAVGICSLLNNDDYAFSGHRAHGHYLAKGGSLKSLIAEIYGKKTGCSKGKGGSQHLVDISAGFLASTAIVSGTIPVAVGAAFGSKIQNKGNISVAFFGDAAVEEGTTYESINFAALHKLPILFACENNLYATYSHISERQPSRQIYSMVKGHGIESILVDGNDVISVYEQTQMALNKIKQGEGPIFMEFKTYRWREHCGPNYDNNLGYRSEEEFLSWKRKCPIEKLEKYVIEKKIMTQEEISLIKQKIQDEIEEAFLFAKESPFPEEQQLFENIYTEG